MIFTLAIFLLCVVNLAIPALRVQCDLIVYIDQRAEALVYFAKPKSLMETDPKNCKMAMHVELNEFVRKWNNRSLDEIDRGSLPPLFHFIINSDEQKVVPNFGELPKWTTTSNFSYYSYQDKITRVYDSSWLPSSTKSRPNLRKYKFDVDVGLTTRAFVYFGVSPKEEEPKERGYMSLRISMKEFLQEWYKMDPKNIDWSRLPKLLYFRVDDTQLVLPLAENNSLYKPVNISEYTITGTMGGSGVGAAVLRPTNLTAVSG